MSFIATIADRSIYNAGMVRSMMDKMFFIDKVDASVIVDYGCANGHMLGLLRMLFPDNIYIGFDISEPMLAEARALHPDITFTNDWNEVRRLCIAHAAQGKKNCLALLSLIHEVYAYLNPTEIAEFWSRVWGDAEFAFDNIAVRDMMVSQTTSRPSDPLAVARIRQKFNRDKLSQWERQWGSLSDNWSLHHFLLTYRYEANWERELRENYLPRPLEEFLASIPHGYIPTYLEHFVLPFVRRQVREDFKILVPDPTHLKLILEREAVW